MIDTDGLKARTDLVAVVSSYIPLRREGAEWKGKCLAHSPDNNPSMCVVPRKGFVHCMSCGWHADVIEFVQAAEGCDFKTACEKLGATKTWEPVNGSAAPAIAKLPERETRKPPKDAAPPDLLLREKNDAEIWTQTEPTLTWRYNDARGELLGYVCRYDRPGVAKAIRCWTWGRRPGKPWAWGSGHFSEPRPLFGLDRLAERPRAKVLVVEGEKAVDAAALLLPAYVVVTWPAGARAWHKVDWAPIFRREVHLWPDADSDGVAAMEGIGSTLHRNNCAKLKVISPDGQPKGWDLSDAAADGWTQDQTLEWARPRVKDFTPALLPADRPRQAITAPAVEITAPAVETTANAVDRPQDRAVGAEGRADATPADIQAPPTIVQPAPAAAPPAVTALASSAIVTTPRVIEGAATAADLKPRREWRGPIVDAPKRPDRPRLAAVDGKVVGRPPTGSTVALPIPLSDDAIGCNFAETYGENWKYVPEWSSIERETWFYWAGDGWHKDVLGQHYNLARDLCREAAHSADAKDLRGGERRALDSAGKAASVLKIAKHHDRIAAHNRIWDADPWLLGVPGGVVNLGDGSLLPPEPDQYITRRTTVAPREGEHPLFDRVVARASKDDAEVTAYLWRWFGYLLTGDVREEAFLFLHGLGGSGKGTLVKVITDIMGDYAAASSIDTFTEGKGSRHPQEIAKLDGIRFTYASETEENRRWNESLIKWLTGRDKVTARYMRQNDFEFWPQFKLLIYGNHRPMIRGIGEEMRRRIHLIEYGGSIPDGQRDTGLKDKLRAEYPAILHSMIRGCLSWQEKGGLLRPDVVLQSVEDYLMAEDTIGAWLEDCCEIHPNHTLVETDGYDSFRAWSKGRGEWAAPFKQWMEKMQQRGLERKRTPHGRAFAGLKIKFVMPPDRDWIPDR